MPESKSSTICLTFFQCQFWVKFILTIEVMTVGGDEGFESEAGITLENLGFREKQYCRVMDLGIMFQDMIFIDNVASENLSAFIV